MQIELSSLWAVVQKQSQKQLTTSMQEDKRLASSRYVFTVPSPPMHLSMQSPQPARQSQSSTEQRNPAHLVNLSTLTLLQHLAKRVSQRKSSADVTASAARNSIPQWSTPSMKICQAQRRTTSQSASTMTSHLHHFLSAKRLTQQNPAQFHASSTALAQTVQSAQTRTQSRSSATTQTNMHKHTSHTTQRSQAVSPFLT